MSHFYGTLYGSEALEKPLPGPGVAGVGGTAQSGLQVILRSPEGSVVIQVYEGEAEDGGLEDRVNIQFTDFELYDGPLSECRFESIRTNTQEVES